jgi:hypothetical protein
VFLSWGEAFLGSHTQDPLVWVVGDKAFSLKQPNAADISFCIDRAQGWLRLCLAEIRAEFPDFEACQAFRVFDVASSDRKPTGCKDHFQRLAKICNVDPDALESQYAKFWDLASQEAKATGSGNKAAWRYALKQVEGKKASTRRAWPDDALRPVVERWVAFCASTSGVEQGFTQAQLAVSDRQNCSPTLETSYVKLKVDVKRDNLDTVCSLAQKVWAACFGASRASGSTQRAPKVERGCKRPREDNVVTEAGFLRLRRRSLSTVGRASHSATMDAIDGLVVDCWSEAHDKELAFTENKKAARMVQASDEGVLIASESDPRLDAAAEVVNNKMSKAALARDRATIRYIEKFDGGSLPEKRDVRGSKTFVEDATWYVLLPTWSLARALQVWDASVFVVADPAALQTKSVHCWAAVLTGGLLLTPGVLSGVGRKVSIAYNAGLATKRTLFITDGFRVSHPAIYDVVVHCATAFIGNRWTLVFDLAAFNAARAKKSVFALVLATRAEKQALCVHMHRRRSMCMRACMHSRVCVRVCVCACVRVCVCVSACLCMSLSVRLCE